MKKILLENTIVSAYSESSKEKNSNSTDHYVIINQGKDIGKRIDFGKAFRAFDFTLAYIEQNKTPLTKLLTLTPSKPEYTNSTNKYKVEVVYAYSENNHKDTLHYFFQSEDASSFFILKLKELHKKHLIGESDFYFTMINTIAENVIKTFSYDDYYPELDTI